jgi:dolichol-phosphate mannosyltransferase
MSDWRHLGRGIVVIPTYNEAGNLEDIVTRVRTSVPSFDVLVVDDASPDGTGELADKLAERDPQVLVRHRLGKQGIGVAYIGAFGWALTHGYDVLVQMDADGSHQPEQLPRLLATLEHADLVLGSRWVPGGSVVNWPRSRQVLSRGGNRYARLALGVGLADATGGYRVWRRATLEGLHLTTVSSSGYCFQIDLVWRAVRAGFRVVEVPIEFVERTRGESKMNRAIVGEAFVRVGYWGARHRMRQAVEVARRPRRQRPDRPRG